MLRWCLVSLVSFLVAMQIPLQGDIVRDDLVIDYSLLNVVKRSKVSKHMKLQNKKILMLCNRAKKENFAKSFTKQQMPLAFNLNHSFRFVFFLILELVHYNPAISKYFEIWNFTYFSKIFEPTLNFLPLSFAIFERIYVIIHGNFGQNMLLS